MQQIFYSLAVLACPVGMGVMMWLMMRSNKKPSGDSTAPASEKELAQLRAELDSLRAGQPIDRPVATQAELDKLYTDLDRLRGAEPSAVVGGTDEKAKR
ncbi:hypothetical protein [Paenarthrobacter sp. Z7-10]|uniref:hypothetical protein n=1 Tax=Paenarthrobacter sp. Z7-10 TaxID=2787635 RepID=UPI0022A95D75|nr:hypothetical protein [Paenarthrobacter sp. Z7-10]